MSTPDAITSEGPILGFKYAYWVVPVVAILYYCFITTIPRGSHPIHRRRALGRTVQVAALFHIPTIYVTYMFDSIVLLYLTFARKAENFEGYTIYTSGSVIAWCLLIIHFPSRPGTPWYRLGGFSVIYLITESCLVAYWQRPQKASESLATAVFVVHVFRLADIGLLVCLTVGTRLLPERCRYGDEETPPLLGADGQQSNDNHRRGYNTFRDETSPRGENLDAQDAAPRDGLIGLIKFFFPYFWPRDRPFMLFLYAAIGVCLLIERVVKLLIPLTLAAITHALIRNPRIFPWDEVVMFLVFYTLDSKAGLPAVRDYLWLPLDKYAYSKISTTAFGKAMALSSDFDCSNDPNSAWECVNNWLSARHAFRTTLFHVIPTEVDIYLAIVALCFMFDLWMAVPIMLAYCVDLVSEIPVIVKYSRSAWQTKYDMDKEHAVFREATSNCRTVLSFNRVEYERVRYSAAVTNHTESHLKFLRWFNLRPVVQALSLDLALVGVCLLAVYQVVSGCRPVALFVALLAFCAQISSYLHLLGREHSSVIRQFIHARNELDSFFTSVPTVSNQDGARPLVADGGAIEFQNVNFTTTDGTHALDNVSFKADPGQTVALVGLPEGGKSTVLDLAMRLHDPSHGIITIDGQNIREVTMESLRANIGVVPRDVSVFSGTVMDNIRYANLHATEEQVHEACKALGFHEKFLSLPDGYATRVNDTGLEFSAGDLRLIAIARVMLQNPRIILLDKATDFIGNNTEGLVHASLKKLCAGRTTLSIAHRLMTIADANEVLVLHDGKLVGQGSHDSLVETNGYYAETLAWLVSTAAVVSAYTAQASDGSQQAEESIAVGDLQESEEIRSTVQTDGDEDQTDDITVIVDLPGPGEIPSTGQTDQENRVQSEGPAGVGGSQKSARVHSSAQIDEGDCIQQTDDSAPTGSETVAEIPQMLTVDRALEISPEIMAFRDAKMKGDVPSDKPRKSSSEYTYGTPSRTSIWKPDAPEFVPASHRPVRIKSQGMTEQKPAHSHPEEGSRTCTERHGAQKENVPGRWNHLIENESPRRVSESDKNTPRVAQKAHEPSERNDGRQTATELDPTSDRVVLRSPKKPRKKRGSKKRQMFRRELTRSEPAGMGLAPFADRSGL